MWSTAPPSPRGVYGKWIRGNNAVIQINNTLFLHGGIVQDENGPLWYRDLALGDEA